MLLLLVCYQVFAKGDTVLIEKKLLTQYSPKANFNTAVWLNPAVKFNMFDENLTTVSIGGDFANNDKAYIMQEGYSDREFIFKAESFYKITEADLVYGSASYSNRHINNVLWNENTDFLFVYPYVTGDGIGGYLHEEDYCFAGGYVRKVGLWAIGAELGYRASISYRDKDPRPRNIVSDLQAKFAFSRSINNYKLGFSVKGRKYNQNSSITYLADKGETPVFHMLGLGMDYVRFRGTHTSVRYSGYEVGGSIDLLPKNTNGFSLAIGGKFMHINKVLSSINYAPINEIDEFNISLDASYLEENKLFTYGVILEGDYIYRMGTENILGDPTANQFVVISQVTQFYSPTIIAEVTGFFGNNIHTNKWVWNIKPYLNYFMLNPSYLASARYIKSSNLKAGVEMQSLWKMKKLSISVDLDFDYSANISSDYYLSDLEENTSVGETLLANIDYLCDSYFDVYIGSRIDYYINQKYSIYLSGGYKHYVYKQSGNIAMGGVSLGFAF